MSRITKYFCAVSLVFGAAIMVSCGGGGGSAPAATVAGENEILISGRAAIGTIRNATVRTTQIINGQLSGTQKDVDLGADGDFEVSMPKGLVHLQVIPNANSTTQDEATGVAVALPLELKLRAAADLTDSSAVTVSLNITPYSEVGVALAEKSGGLTAANINMANSGIANILGFDFLSTKPIQSSDTTSLAGATTNEKKLSLLNAAVSNMAATDVLGCGVKASYGQTIDCTVSKLADQFNMNSAASVQPMVVGVVQTSMAGSTPMVMLGDEGYQSLLGGIPAAGVVRGRSFIASGATALENTAVDILQDGISFAVSAGAYAIAVTGAAVCDAFDSFYDSACTEVGTAINIQASRLDYQKTIAGNDTLIRNANNTYVLAIISSLVYDDKWVNGFPSAGSKLTLDLENHNVSADLSILNWSEYGVSTQEAMSVGLHWNAFYNEDVIIFAYRGTDSLGELLWTDVFSTLLCQQIFSQYETAFNQFNSLVSNPEFIRFLGTRKIILTGHSLGGGVASYIATYSPLVHVSVGFNAAPLCAVTLWEAGFDDTKVYRTVISGDPVSSLNGLGVMYPGYPPVSYPNPFAVVWANAKESHSIDTVLFVLSAAKDLCVTAGCAAVQGGTQSIQVPSPAVAPIVISGVQNSYATSTVPYRPAIILSGSQLSTINKISWDCALPNGSPCQGSPFVWTPSNWAGKVDIFSDTSIKVYPGFLAAGAAAGTYHWTVTFSALNAASVSIPFSVTYQPQAATGIVVDSLSSTSFVSGTTNISTTTSPVVASVTVTGKNLGTVVRIEWRWSGAATGSQTWLNSDLAWNSLVAYSADGKLTLSPTVVQANPAWSGNVIWTGTLIDATGASRNITFSVSYQPQFTPAPTPAPTGQITVGPASLAFSNVPVGTCSSAIFAIQHVSGTPSASGTVSISSTPPFSIYLGSSFAVSNGSAANVSIQFCPTSVSSYSGTAAITSNATFTSGVSSVALSGTAVPALVPLTIVTSSPLAGGNIGSAYSASLSASGGTPPYVWSLVQGTQLPQGLSLSSTGVISGNPVTAGTASFQVQATDSASSPQTIQKALSITVVGMPPGQMTTSAVNECSATVPQVRLTWTQATGVDYYQVYRDGVFLAGVTTTLPSYLDTAVALGEAHTYFIRAVNTGGATDSNTASLTVSCTAPPGQFTLSVVTTCSGTSPVNELHLTGSAGAVLPNSVYRNSALLTTLNVSDFSDTAVTPGASYTYFATASNAVGSTNSNSVLISTAANCAAPVNPSITSLSPQTVTVGDGAFTLTVTGSNFDSSSKIVWDPSGGTPSTQLPTTFVNSTTLTAAIGQTTSGFDPFTWAGAYAVQVMNTATSTRSSTVSFVVYNPVPTVSSVSGSCRAGLNCTAANGFDVRVNGNGIVNNSTTTYVPSTFLQVNGVNANMSTVGQGPVYNQLQLMVNGSLIPTAGNYTLNVCNEGTLQGRACASGVLSVAP